jgi:hypothetical protein
MFIISFSLLFLFDHSQGAVYHLFALHLLPRGGDLRGKAAIFHYKAIGISRMYHTFGYIFVNSLFLII